jgi:hypothetical protein
LERAGIIVKAEQERAHRGVRAFLVPAKSCHDTIAFALVLDLEHHAFVGLVRSRRWFGDDTVESRAFEAAKPIGCSR